MVRLTVLCTPLDQDSWYAATWGTPSPPIYLNQLGVPVLRSTFISDVPAPDCLVPRSQSIALATLIDYTVVTYGRERLPALLAGLGQYENWETLAPAVYGVPAITFEAGWQNYLLIYDHQGLR